MPKESAKSSKRGKVKAKGSVEVVEADDDANYTKRPRSHRRYHEYMVPYKWSFEKCPKRGNANELRSRERSESSSKSDSPLDPSEEKDRIHSIRHHIRVFWERDLMSKWKFWPGFFPFLGSEGNGVLCACMLLYLLKILNIDQSYSL